ncbi:MAG: DUF6281 family protein [Ornithinimicrobium sp.]
MSDFESRLRTQLAEASTRAPTFTGQHTQHSPAAPAPEVSRPTSRRMAWALAVTATVLALVGGGTFLATMSGDTDSSQASCAAEIVFDGRTYAGYGDPLRMPRPGQRVGTGSTPPCADGQRAGNEAVEVWSLPGVEPDVAVMAQGVVWIEGRASALPEELDELTEPVKCTAADESTITGRVVSVEASVGEEELRPQPPYEATVKADGGATLPLSQYSSVTVQLVVTSQTQGGRDAELLDAALRSGDHLDISVRCVTGRFEATSWRLAP